VSASLTAEFALTELPLNKELTNGFAWDRRFPEFVTNEDSSAAKTADLLKVSPIMSEDLMHCSIIELACRNGVVGSIFRWQSASVELIAKKNNPKRSENV
jgi:hypothetical protein